MGSCWRCHVLIERYPQKYPHFFLLFDVGNNNKQPRKQKSPDANRVKAFLIVLEYTRTIYGDPTGNRTRATAVKGRCPNR